MYPYLLVSKCYLLYKTFLSYMYNAKSGRENLHVRTLLTNVRLISVIVSEQVIVSTAETILLKLKIQKAFSTTVALQHSSQGCSQ